MISYFKYFENNNDSLDSLIQYILKSRGLQIYEICFFIGEFAQLSRFSPILKKDS